MHLINSIGKAYFQTRIAAINYFVQHPHESQKKVLEELLDNASETEWGKGFQYSKIKNYEQFSATIPLQDYDSLKPYFERMQAGEKNVLWRGIIQWFAKSSGTTNDKSKYIPVSKEGLHLSHIKTGKDFLSTYLRDVPESKFFTGKGVVMGGSYHPNEINSEIFVGDVSAILMKNLDTWIQYFRSPGLGIALLKNWDEKLAAIATQTMQQNVTNISGVPSWTMLLLQEVVKRRNVKFIKEVWPNVELFCHGGVGFLPYKKQFETLIGKEIHYRNIYNASEGFFAFQDSEESCEMLLHLDNGVFYEFIPFDGHTISETKIVSLENVQLNQNYALVISTNSGLWRYQIGDTIEFTSLHPYRIKITGRTKQFINVFGEEVTVDNTDSALAKTCEALNVTIRDYTVAPQFMEGNTKGRHEWAIEFQAEPANFSDFEALLDKNLQAINSDYEAKRNQNLVLEPLCVHCLKANTFYSWLTQKNKLGSQFKIPKLSNDRVVFMEILARSN